MDNLDFSCFFHGVAPRKHVDYDFVDKSTVTRIEKMTEILSKSFEKQVYKLILHFWCELLVEREVFDEQVMIIFEGLLYSFWYAKV